MMQGKFRGFDIATSDKGVATITFNQPDHLNGTTQAIKRDLTEALTQIQMDDDVRVVVITGTSSSI